MPSIRIKVDEFRTHRQKQLLKNYLNEPGVRKSINEMIGNYINNYVPMESGELRNSMRANEKSISWGANSEAGKYAHYQYEGEVYGPNIPITQGGIIVGWHSIAGSTKSPTGRELGIPGEWKGWIFGYTTPGTKHHWDKLFNQDIRAKAEVNREITRQLKRECKARGLKV